MRDGYVVTWKANTNWYFSECAVSSDLE